MAELLLESPLEGELIALKEVNDPAFASEAMGRGFGADFIVSCFNIICYRFNKCFLGYRK